MGFKNNGPGCSCGCGSTPPTNCATPLKVSANYTCNGYVTNLPGVAVKVVRRSDGTVVATGTTDNNGDWSVYLPPIPGDSTPARGYEVSATYKNTDPNGLSPGPSGTQAPGLPRRVWCGCANTIVFGFPPFRFGATAVGCGNVAMPGVTVRLFQRYSDGSTALLLGTGTTDGTGAVTLDLDHPITDVTRLLGVADGPDFYQAIVGFATGPGNAPNRCSIGFNLSQQSGQAFMYPDVQGLDSTPRHTSNGYNATDYQSCCQPLNGPAHRYRPYPATLHVTVGPYSFDVTSTGGIWGSTSFQAAMQGAAKQPDGTYACNPNPYYWSWVSACVKASATCDGLGLSVATCHGMGVPIDMTCAEVDAYLALNPNGLDYIGIPCDLTSRSGDPLVLEGECSLGHWVVSE